MPQLTKQDAQKAVGQNLLDRNTDKVGTIDDIYVDTDTGKPEWAVVTSGMFGKKAAFVPLLDAAAAKDGIQVVFEKAEIKDAPQMEPDGQLTQEQEASLYRHYGLQYTEDASSSGLPGAQAPQAPPKSQAPPKCGEAVRDTSGPNTDNAMTRSEEQMRVGTIKRPSQTVGLKKTIVSENVTTTVPVQKETARVEREPITDQNRGEAMRGGDLTTEEAEMTLSEDEVVVEKQVAPVERVRLDKDVEVEQREVNESVRKEKIDVEQGKTKPPPR